MRHLLLASRIAVELAEQGIAVLLSPVRQVRDEVFHLFAGGIAKRLDAAEIGCIRLDQVGIELMLADDLAESVANRTDCHVPVGRLRRQLLRLWRGLRRARRADPISSTEQMPIP